MTFDDLPGVNAVLNSISTVLLLSAFVQIRRKRVASHRALMLMAFAVSVAFLGCYLLHKWHLYTTTGAWNTTFQGSGGWRTFYLTVLLTHVVLAVTVPFLAIVTIRRGLRMAVERHRAIARITFPIWLYVSVTGVLVYFMLYKWFV
jgi:uncharacterized membrane protein YozB (DUF420 family)